MHQNIGPADLHVMKRRNRKHPSKVRTMAESRKNKLSIPNSHTVYSSVPIPYLLLPTQFGKFCFFKGKQIKATMIKVAQRNRLLATGLECFGKTLPISGSSHIRMSHPDGFFHCGTTLKQTIYACKPRACHFSKAWLPGLRSLRARHPNRWCFRSTITLWALLRKLLVSTAAAHGTQLHWSCSTTSYFTNSQRQSEQAAKSPWLDNGDLCRQYCKYL